MAKTFEGKVYDDRHGGPFDRGAADSYYGRPSSPHYFKGGTYGGDEVSAEHMTAEEIEAYLAGFEYNEQAGERKKW